MQLLFTYSNNLPSTVLQYCKCREELTGTEIGNTNYLPHTPVTYLANAHHCSIIGEMTGVSKENRDRDFEKRL